MTRRFLSPAIGLVAAAFAGGAVALGGAALVGGLDGSDATTTTVRTVAERNAAEPASPSTTGLSVAEIYARAKGAVVQVDATGETEETGFFGEAYRVPSRSQGSGFVIDRAGRIVTNWHVVQNATEVRVSFSNDDEMTARVIGTDPATDLAVLKVDAESRALTPLELGDSDQVRVGDPVVAIGNPLGFDRTATAGIVSALQRRITAPTLTQDPIDKVIQTDAQINPGNSGGPLLNARGEVIGVNSQIATAGGGGNIGIGFAIPSNTVKNVVAQLIDKGRVDRPFLGVEAIAIDDEIARVFSLPAKKGLIVQRVCRGGAAEEAGIRGGTTEVVVAGQTYRLGGDVIVEIEGEEVGSVDELRTMLGGHEPGETITVALYRETENGSRRLEREVKLGRKPAASC